MYRLLIDFLFLLICFSSSLFSPCGRVLEPIPASYVQKHGTPPGWVASLSQGPVWNIWGFITLLRGTVAVLWRHTEAEHSFWHTFQLLFTTGLDPKKLCFSAQTPLIERLPTHDMMTDTFISFVAYTLILSVTNPFSCIFTHIYHYIYICLSGFCPALVPLTLCVIFRTGGAVVEAPASNHQSTHLVMFKSRSLQPLVVRLSVILSWWMLFVLQTVIFTLLVDPSPDRTLFLLPPDRPVCPACTQCVQVLPSGLSTLCAGDVFLFCQFPASPVCWIRTHPVGRP